MFEFSNYIIFWDIQYTNMRKLEKCQKYRLFEYNSWSLNSVDHFEILISRNLETCASPYVILIFFFFDKYLIFFQFSRYKLWNSVTVELGRTGLGKPGQVDPKV